MCVEIGTRVYYNLFIYLFIAELIYFLEEREGD